MSQAEDKRARSQAVLDALQHAGVVVHQRLEGGLLSEGGIAVWPVVPRRRVTAIHRAQAEVIRLITPLGWKTHLLIADCQSPGRVDPTVDAQKFCGDLQRYCSARGLHLDEPVFLSHCWRPRHKGYAALQEYFRLMTCEMTLEDIRLMNRKGYGKAEVEEIDARPTLDNLRPALSAAAVLTMAPPNQPCVIIAGFDEDFQWRKTTAVADGGKKICTILIPKLMVDREHQVRQKGMFPSWDSQEELAQQMEQDAQSNLASWIFHMHCCLPSFPKQDVDFGAQRRLRAGDWDITAPDVPDPRVTKRDVARVAWPILGPIPRDTAEGVPAMGPGSETAASANATEATEKGSPPSSQVSVLFVAADPTDATRLRLGEEYRQIQEKLKLSKQRDHVRLEQPQLSARTSDISQALLDCEPQIVHFSGHGSADGDLVFEDKAGKGHSVSSDALGRLFKQFTSVQCVVLNACFSGLQADAIAEHVSHVIGMDRSISDTAAIAYAEGFYQAIGAGRSIPEAHELGCAQIAMREPSEQNTPVLIAGRC